MVIFEVLTALIMVTVFWDTTPCSLQDINLSDKRAASSFRIE